MSDKNVIVKPRTWLELHNPVFEPDQLVYIEGEIAAGVRIGNGIDPWAKLKSEASAADLPAHHASTHGIDGSDPIHPEDIGAVALSTFDSTIQTAISTSEAKLLQADTALKEHIDETNTETQKALSELESTVTATDAALEKLQAELTDMDESLQEHLADQNPHPVYSLVGHTHTLQELPEEVVGGLSYSVELTVAGKSSSVVTLPEQYTDPKVLQAGLLVDVDGAYHNALLYGGYAFTVNGTTVQLTVYNDDAKEHLFLVNVKK